MMNMKAPTKIFVPAEMDPLGFEAYRKRYPGDIEFIRKDELTAWLKDMIDIYDGSDEYDTGRRIAYRDVLEKISEV